MRHRGSPTPVVQRLPEKRSALAHLRQGPRLRIISELLVIGSLIAWAWVERATIDRSLRIVGKADWNWLVIAGVMELLSMMAFARTQRIVLRAAGVHVPIPSMAATALAANALSVSLPMVGPGAAMVFTYRRFQRVAHDPASSGWSLLMSGLISSLVWVLLLAAGAVLSGNPTATLGGVLGGGAILVMAIIGALALHRQRLQRAITRPMIRLVELLQHLTGSTASDANDVVNNALNRLSAFRMSPFDWAQTVALAAINWLASVGCLVAAIVAVGARVPWANVLLVYCVGAAASSFNLTPGGLGVVEAVLTGGLVAAGLTSAVAFGSVLIFRLFSLWLAMLVGWIIYALIQRTVPDAGRP
jgi:uncharacterized membrane protein YbhN (UPF0104 family)